MAATAPPSQAQRRKVRVYDFTQSESFDRNELRVVKVALDGFGRRAGRLLSSHLRVALRVEVGEMTQVSWSQASQTLEEPAHVCSFSLTPLPGKAVLHLPLSLSMHLVDLAFGGLGEGPFPKRALSEVEQSVVAKLGEEMLEELVPSLSAAQVTAVASPAHLSSAVLVQMPAPQSTFLVTELNVTVPQSGAYKARLCLPLLMLKPALPSLAGETTNEGAGGDATARMVAERLLDVEVEAAIRFPSIRLSSSAITALEPGDVVPLKVVLDEPLELAVGELVRAHVMPGRSGRRFSCTVVDIESESDR